MRRIPGEGRARLVQGVAASVGSVLLVTGVVALLDNHVPALSLGALYVLAVLPVAVVWGLAYAIPVSIASMLAFNWFFLPPVHSFTLSDSRNWAVLVVYLVVAVVASELAARSRRRALEAERREREATLLADLATTLLRGRTIEPELGRIEEAAAGVLGVERVRIDLGPRPAAGASEAPYPLEAGGRVVGTLFVDDRSEPALAVRRRLLPALASLLALAIDRERLEHEALETEALRRSDTIKTTILRTVSHDLRTPLATTEAAIGGLLSPEVELGEAERRELLETIRDEHAILRRLVENLLDLSRLQAGAARPVPEIWPVEQLVAEAVALLPESGRVVVVQPESEPAVSVDAPQLERALVNLLDNALKASPPGEPVTVRVTATRKEAIVRVVDHGPGLAEAELERVFEPFHRAPGAPPRGVGLGLAIARGFVEANGGRIWGESHAGQGATFAIALPLVSIPPQAWTGS